MFYLLNKPKGISSFGAIRKFAKENHIDKVGHTGTLDPLASGLLLVATDEDTKLIEYVDKGYKTYQAFMRLGEVSTSYDLDGEITVTNCALPSQAEVTIALKSFEGFYDQLPPAFSAKKINGQKAYDLARQGISVELQPSKVEIKQIGEINQISPNEYSFVVTVSRGTYIRSLISDLGQKLGCGALMTDLVRTKIGSLSLTDANAEVDVKTLLTIPIIEVQAMQELIQGKVVATEKADGKYVLSHEDQLMGIVEATNGKIKPVKLFGNKFRRIGL